MRKMEWLLPPISVGLTLWIALMLLRAHAPGLLGIPVDLQLVQVSEQVPPFFDGVFRDAEDADPKLLIPDPYLLRARPFYPDEGRRGGPHDVLGFRNRCVPHAADIVVIGDSQTYGHNVEIDQAWPAQLARWLPESTVYSMAVAGWGPIACLEIFPKALRFRPRVVVVAFYTGNDPLEGFTLAYGAERWASLRLDPELRASDIPDVPYPAPRSDWWLVEFPEGLKTGFTPTLRLSINQDHPAVHAGYAIMAEAARRMGRQANEVGVRVIFTIIPTKELVYARRVERAGFEPPADYRALVDIERRHIERLAAVLQAIPGAEYVDLVGPLQEAALGEQELYPRSTDGHPVAAGYALISKILAAPAAAALQSASAPADTSLEAGEQR